ncbi:MAG: aminotransferase class I/II-fold pyridoxal phosphate-dependent enzyme [Candidatus Hydrogenedentes bacterium]|nr:aminotransferase class I/II-fold pyridoxal phosphate-dependent enzyme [Candidatus Hydrogenedentota bacterium]
MRVLVTGGAGYLGCRLVPTLIERGHDVRVFDRFCFGGEPVQSFARSPRCEIAHGDVRRLQECPDLFAGVDAVIHLAGLANDPSCDLDPDSAMDVNFEASKELATLAHQSGVGRFVFVSSCSVYGKGVFDLLDEESPTNPVATYGASKLAAEQALLQMQSPFFEPVIARPATLFGWSPRMRFDLAVNQMTATAVRTHTINVFGGGAQWRPFVHVADAARALAGMLEAPAEQVSGQVFNVGSNDATFRIRDLAERLAALFPDVRVEAVRADADLRDYRVVFDKVAEVLGFAPTYSVEDGAREVAGALEDAALDPFDAIYFNVRRMQELRATPVDEGGEPIASHFIPLARPSLGPEEEQAVVDTLRSGWLTTGARVQAFEHRFAQAVGAPEAVALSSCTAALHLSLVHLGVEPGDEVITSPLTWPSTANTVVNMGAKLVLADIDPATLNVDPAAVEDAITERTKVIMPVHLAGQPCDLDAIYAVARKHGVAVLEDAAHALGARYKGVPIGGYGAYSCFSFYPIKNITTIDGGTVTLKDAEEAKHLRVLANNGMSAIAWNRYGRSAVAAPAEVVSPGFKYRMHDVAAAIGNEQIKKLDAFLAARRRLAGKYRAVLADLDEIRLLDLPEHTEHAWHLFIIRLNLDKLSKTRDEIAYALRRENVGTGVHFLGLHLHDYYRKALGLGAAALPEATAASHDILSLPLFPAMSDKNLGEVVDALKKVIVHARR